MTKIINSNNCPGRSEVDRNEYDRLTNLLTGFNHSDVPIFPFACPKCGSLKVSVVLGTALELECLDCGARFVIKEMDFRNSGAKSKR
jgi:hypothetical protein